VSTVTSVLQICFEFLAETLAMTANYLGSLGLLGMRVGDELDRC